MRTLALTQSCAALLLAGLLPCLAHAAPPVAGAQSGAKPGKAKPAKASSKNKTQIGELSITDYVRSSGGPSKPIVFVGPDIRVETRDKKRALHVLVFADHIEARNPGGGRDSAQLTGNVRYTITEKIKQGERTVERVIEGTARQADYTEATNTLRLLNDVHATLNDPTRFLTPAVLSVGSLVIPGEGLYRLAGNAALNDIQFTPLPPSDKPAKDGKKPRPAFQSGMVHAHGFATGRLDTDKEARFDGPLVVIESDNPAEKTHNVFKAPHFLAGLEKGSDSLEATGGVAFDCRRTNAKGDVQTLTGTAGQILSHHGQPLILEGGVEASLTDPVALKEPATLAATRVTALFGDAPRFVVTGSPQHTRLSFAPRPAPAAGATGGKSAPPGQGGGVRPADSVSAPTGRTPDTSEPPVINAAPPDEADAQASAPPSVAPPASSRQTPFVIGDIVVTDFATATYVPEKSLVVDGPRVHFVSSDKVTKNDAELTTPHLEADFVVSTVKGKDAQPHKLTTLREMRATGGVAFNFQQPGKDSKLLNLAGAGSAATFTNKSAQSQVVKVLNVSKLDAAGTGPPVQGIDSEAGDTLTYDLVTQDFDLVTPKRTFVASFKPVNSPTPPPANANGAAKKSTKKKHK